MGDNMPLVNITVRIPGLWYHKRSIVLHIIVTALYCGNHEWQPQETLPFGDSTADIIGIVQF